MFGLDEAITSHSDGTSVLLVAGMALVLGLRHATDPDHVAAVSTLVASRRGARAAVALAAAWGVGHAAALFAFGLPIVLYRAFVPERVLQSAEVLVGMLIVMLALWLLVRWRRGELATSTGRTPLAALAVGLAHGVGGSAGVGILIVASVESQRLAVFALGLLAAFSAVSMVTISGGFGRLLAARSARQPAVRAAPVFGVAGLAFGAWYTLAALSLAPYYF